MNLIEFGDCRETMRKWVADGVKAQMCVTSPPYFGLRDYGHEGQIGLEQTPEQYIAAMVEVFRCVRDVLADDGTLWLNIGDSYAGSWGNQGRKEVRGMQRPINGEMMQQVHDGRYPTTGSKTGSLERTPGCKNKDLIGIPWLLAFALRADGWYLRSDIVWAKGNPMPESVMDRPTRSHEYIFLLTKRERYFYDHEAVKEPAVSDHPSGNGFKRDARQSFQNADGTARGNEMQWKDVGGKRNRRSVWHVNAKPYKGAHFATFPPALIEPCILAGSRPGDIVLDPFMGSGTTAAVALQHGRQYLGCELNAEYGALQAERINEAMEAVAEAAAQPDLFERAA